MGSWKDFKVSLKGWLELVDESKEDYDLGDRPDDARLTFDEFVEVLRKELGDDDG
jgi:hypothetical protein